MRTSSILVAVVIVTFKNAKMLKDLLEDLRKQTRAPDEIIVVDNASTDNTENIVNAYCGEATNYIQLKENTGSAGGYYEGIKAAIKRSDFVWTLDDDVRLERDSLEELLNGFIKLDSFNRIGSVRSVGKRQNDLAPYRLKFFSWRGTLIKTEYIRRFGLPMRSLFLYGEDLEYSLRFNVKGLYCYWIPSSVCTEQRETGKIDYSFLGNITRIYELPFQLYYAFRNNLYIFIRYKCFLELLHFLLYTAKCTIIILFWKGNNKAKKLSAIYMGLLDGWRRKIGKNKTYVP